MLCGLAVAQLVVACGSGDGSLVADGEGTAADATSAADALPDVEPVDVTTPDAAPDTADTKTGDTVESDGSDADAGSPPDADSVTSDTADACEPTTCNAIGEACGTFDDGCGGVIDCGAPGCDAPTLDTFARTLGGPLHDGLTAASSTNDGGAILAGYTESSGAGESDGWLVRVDGFGSVVWEKTLGGEGADVLYALEAMGDGTWSAAGWTYSSGTGDRDAWVARVDGSGGSIWQRTFGGEAADSVASLVPVADGIVTAGWTESFGEPGQKLWVVRLDTNGEIIWQRAFGDTGYSQAYEVMALDGGDVLVIGGATPPVFGNFSVRLLRIHSNGEVVWKRTYGDAGVNHGYGLGQTSDGRILLAGITALPSTASVDGWIAEVDNDGGLVWQSAFGGAGEERFWALAPLGDGFVATGYTTSVGSGPRSAWITGFDDMGGVQWEQALSGAGEDALFAAVPIGADHILAVGETASYGAGGRDGWLLVLDSVGEVGASCGPTQGVETPLLESALTAADPAIVPIDTSAVSLDWDEVSVATQSTLGAQCAGSCVELPVPDALSVDGAGCVDSATVVPHLTWETASAGIGFALEVFDGPSCEDAQLQNVEVGLTPFFAIPWSWDLEAGELYGWRVRALGNNVETCDGPVSACCVFQVDHLACEPDPHEPNDTCHTAAAPLHPGWVQSHNLCGPGEDWIPMHTCAGRVYSIVVEGEAVAVGAGVDLLGSDCESILAEAIPDGPEKLAITGWPAPMDGIMHIRISAAGVAETEGADYVVSLQGNTSACETWATSIGLSHKDELGSIVQTSDGGYIAVGLQQEEQVAFNPDTGLLGIVYDWFVVRYDTSGHVMWKGTYDNSTESAVDVLQTADGGFLMAGTVASFTGQPSDAHIVKLAPNGAPQWQQSFGDSGFERLSEIVELPDGGFVGVGTTSDFADENADVWVVRLDSQGALVWQRHYGDIDDEVGYSIIPVPGGGFVVAGESLSFGENPGWANGWLLQIDSGGSPVWQKAYGGTEFGDNLLAVREVPGGGLAAVGITLSFGTDPGVASDAWVIRTDAVGEIVWQKTIGVSGYADTAVDLQVTADGHLVVAGGTKSFGSPGTWDFWLLALDTDGALLWERRYGQTSKHDYPAVLAPTADGGWVLGGTTGATTANSDFWVLKTDDNGELAPVCTNWEATTATVLDSSAVPFETNAGWGVTTTTPGDVVLSANKPAISAAFQCGGN